MASFTNIAESAGFINSVDTGLTGAITIQLVDGLFLTKSADKQSWADGLLTFTILIDNTDGTEPYEDVVVSDTLDPLIVTLVTDSVTLNGTPVAYAFDDVTGKLVISEDSPFAVAAGATAKITFQVQKVTAP